MKRIVLIIAALIVAAGSLWADENTVHSLDVNYLLLKNGSAVVTEVWNVDVKEGTEWYLVKNNMRDIEVLDFAVQDERGVPYVFEDEWDLDRSLEEKAGRCGINYTDEGLELCWGLGSYEHHVYSIRYVLTNAVQSLQDYDMFHLQLVNKGLSSAPQNVRAVVEVEDYQMDTTYVRIWGFGYYGSSTLVGGKAVYQSSEPFVRNSSMIALLAFEKGWFESASVVDIPFDEHLEVALEDSDFDGGVPEVWVILLIVFSAFVLLILIVVAAVNAQRRSILGVSYKEVEDSRDIPFGGELPIADKILYQLSETRREVSIVSALMLRMIYNDILKVSQDADGKIEISFNPEFGGQLDKVTQGLYDMMKAAGGEDGILQEKEFSMWSKKNYKKVGDWIKSVGKTADEFVEKKGYKLDGRYNREFQAEARKLLGLKKFLSKYEELKASDVTDAALWKEFLVYAALFEVSEKLMKQLNELNPGIFEDSKGCLNNYYMWHHLLHNNRSLAAAITNTTMHSGSSSSSFSGGSGFSAGGVGGGAR